MSFRPFQADLSFARLFHQQLPKLDVLVNNAAASLQAREVTPDGFERHWATNVLGPIC